jgi:F420-non-reducing hydrogenase iron-sulfur subunit
LAVVEEMVEVMGLEKERFRLVWCSSAEADRFAAAVRQMSETVRALGPSPYRGDAPQGPQAGEVAACL